MVLNRVARAVIESLRGQHPTCIRRGDHLCLSGTADIDPSGKIVAEGDTSPEAMHKRARYTIDVIGASLAQLRLA